MPATGGLPGGPLAAGRQLRTLLLSVGPYREKWEAQARSIVAGEISQAAVCQVIAAWLWDTGQRPETETDLARRLKDRVSDALDGSRLTPETLRWFAGAFGISAHDRQRLTDLLRGAIGLTDVVGRLPPPPPGSRITAPSHQTTLLFEHHYIGAAGLPVRHHTQQTIYAVVDGLDHYQYRFDTPEAEITMRRGGTAGPVRDLGGGVHAVDITFPRALAYGETQYLDYDARFRYSVAPATEFRRASHRRVEHLEIRVEFAPERLPRRLWWAQWSDYREPGSIVVHREEASLDQELSARRYLNSIERAVVGFCWEW